MIRRCVLAGSSDEILAFAALRLFAVLFHKRFPAGVLAACSASRAARFGSDAGKKPLRVAR